MHCSSVGVVAFYGSSVSGANLLCITMILERETRDSSGTKTVLKTRLPKLPITIKSFSKAFSFLH